MRVAILSGETCGTNYFRGTLVKRAIDRWGSTHGVEAFHAHVFSMSFLTSVDVFYLLRPIPELMPIELLHRIKREGKAIVVDYDDDVLNVPAWSSSATTFDQEHVRKYCRSAFKVADLVTTTSAAAAGIVRGYAPQAKIHVIPNAFDRAVKLLRPMPVHQANDIPCVGWSGGSQHNEDLAALMPVFHACLKRGYGLTFIGDGPRGLRGLSPRHKISWMGGTGNIEMYQQLMPLAGFDVGVAPVLDIPFNHSKSCLKAIEYSWLSGVPAVLSDIPCYEEIGGDRFFKVKGFDVDAWMAAIDAGIAITQREGRRYHLPERYDLNSTFYGWIEAFAQAHVEATGRVAPGYTKTPVVAIKEPTPLGV